MRSSASKDRRGRGLGHGGLSLFSSICSGNSVGNVVQIGDISGDSCGNPVDRTQS